MWRRRAESGSDKRKRLSARSGVHEKMIADWLGEVKRAGRYTRPLRCAQAVLVKCDRAIKKERRGKNVISEIKVGWERKGNGWFEFQNRQASSDKCVMWSSMRGIRQSGGTRWT